MASAFSRADLSGIRMTGSLRLSASMRRRSKRGRGVSIRTTDVPPAGFGAVTPGVRTTGSAMTMPRRSEYAIQSWVICGRRRRPTGQCLRCAMR
jgi:hypothetical protein